MKLSASHNKGFTLLEILVVLGIISLIVAVTTVSFSTSQKKARDVRRKTDLRSIAQALEQYYSTCSFVYPATLTAGGTIACPLPARTYMTNIPSDPSTATAYVYTHPDGTNATFSVCAPNTPPLETESTATYCVINQQ